MKKCLAAMLVLLSFLLWGTTGSAEENRGHVFRLLEDGFNVQVSISEEARTQKDIEKLLAPYFTPEAQKRFMEENVVKVDGGYAALGSDAAAEYIPFFSYDEDTLIEKKGNRLIVSEEFSGGEDGPLTYDAHREAVVLIKHEGSWKVNEIIMDYKVKEAEEKQINEQAGNSEVLPAAEQGLISLFPSIHLKTTQMFESLISIWE